MKLILELHRLIQHRHFVFLLHGVEFFLHSLTFLVHPRVHVTQLLVRLLRVEVVQLAELLAHLLLCLFGDLGVEKFLQLVVDIEVRLPVLSLAEWEAIQEVM